MESIPSRFQRENRQGCFREDGLSDPKRVLFAPAVNALWWSGESGHTLFSYSRIFYARRKITRGCCTKIRILNICICLPWQYMFLTRYIMDHIFFINCSVIARSDICRHIPIILLHNGVSTTPICKCYQLPRVNRRAGRRQACAYCVPAVLTQQQSISFLCKFVIYILTLLWCLYGYQFMLYNVGEPTEGTFFEGLKSIERE
jgi:hypothetical protein